jgi:invasion protein IalB
MAIANAAFHRWRAAVLAAALLAGGELQASELLTRVVGATPAETDAVRTITLADDWQVTCDKASGAPSCRMATTGAAKTAKGHTVAVQLASESSDGLFFFLAPLDLLVAKGVEMRIDDGKALKLAYRSCHAQGCVIPFRLAGALESSFRRGSRLDVRLFELDGSPIDIEMSLLGFTAASRAMEGG